MGGYLPKPLESTVIEQHEERGWRVGVAEMNGWRICMEDAHLVSINDNWGFFGVFDGHGGDACSTFVAKRLQEELANKPCPQDDDFVRQLVLRIDKEFLAKGWPSGSTAAMCLVRKSHENHHLLVLNIGDSRVLLGRCDGTIVDGGGTDAGLTTDHKPNHPSEFERISRCGGKVETGKDLIARVVTGEGQGLAVSRSLGDCRYKKLGSTLESQPVCADPDMGNFQCGQSDFLMLVCDGVSEGRFRNKEVIEYVAELLRLGNHPGDVAGAVCKTALERGSSDNITCMIVTFDGSEPKPTAVKFTPGPLTQLGNRDFKAAYTAMATKAGLTLAHAVEQRYEFVKERLEFDASGDLEAEIAMIGQPAGTKGSNERAQWFRRWLEHLPQEEGIRPAQLYNPGSTCIWRRGIWFMIGTVLLALAIAYFQ